LPSSSIFLNYKKGGKMKKIARLSVALSVLFLIVTANESNAAMQLQQDNESISFKQDYLPNYTVNTMDSEQPVLLARRWGHYNKTHVCFDKRNKWHPRKRRTYKSRWCKNKRAKKARKAKKHYRKMMVAFHKRKAKIKKIPICMAPKDLLSPQGLNMKKDKCTLIHPARKAAMTARAKAKLEKERAEAGIRAAKKAQAEALKRAQMAKQRALKKAAEIRARAQRRAAEIRAKEQAAAAERKIAEAKAAAEREAKAAAAKIEREARIAKERAAAVAKAAKVRAEQAAAALARKKREAERWAAKKARRLASSISSFFSDRRLKKNIVKMDEYIKGINWYTFEYIWDSEKHIGFMADEVKKVFPEAVVTKDGYDTVDYGYVFSQGN